MLKPLGFKAYGSIPHLPNSRAGEKDIAADSGMVRIATKEPRSKYDTIIVQEKLDGSCCAVAKINSQLVPLQRKGYPAETSPFEMHHLFCWWVENQQHRFNAMLQEGERVVGEWLAQAHGTRYNLNNSEPFVPFDIMVGHSRLDYITFLDRVMQHGFKIPYEISFGPPITVDDALEILGEYGFHGAIDRVEGAVWRVERYDPAPKTTVVDFLVKFVRPDKVDGLFLPEVSGKEPVWNWYPEAGSSWESSRYRKRYLKGRVIAT